MVSRPRFRSPDIQIYKPQLTSVLSIMHRLTGVMLSIGGVVLVVWMATVAIGGNTYSVMHLFLTSWIGVVLLFGWTFALFFHLCNGIRHLAWDLDFGFELRSIYLSGWAVVMVSTALTLITWLFAWMTG